MKSLVMLFMALGLTIPKHHLGIANRVAGSGMPQCQSQSPDGTVSNCMPDFAVRHGAVVNGWSMDGQITFSSAAIRKLNDDEFALLAGHEIAHYYLGHKVRSRAAELEADRIGAELACKAGFNQISGVTLFERLRPSKFHPPKFERIREVINILC